MMYYKRDPDRALAGMAELTLQERGAYNTIIDALYSRDGQLPDDDDILRRLMGCHGNEWRAVKAKLIAKGKVWIEDGFIKAKRVDEVLEEAATFSEKQRKRAGKRWETAGKRPGNARENAGKLAGNSEIPQEKQRNWYACAKMPLTAIATATDINKSLKEAFLGLLGLAAAGANGQWSELPECLAEWQSYDLSENEILAEVQRIVSRGCAPETPRYFTPAMHALACKKAGWDIPRTKPRRSTFKRMTTSPID